jgi:pimeloyl-ACP methyl ester carboxylesterase
MADPPLPDVPGVTHREVDLGDVRIHVAEAGDGPPLLLLHGWPQHWWSWRLLMPALAELVGTPGLGPRTMTSGTRFVRTIIRAGSGPDARWTVEELDVYAEVLRRPARAEASSACYRTFLTREAPATLRRGDRSDELHVPTLLLMGGASALRRVIDPPPSRNVVVGTIPGAGHFLPEEAPTQVLEHAVPFLAGRRPPGPVPARTRAQTRG